MYKYCLFDLDGTLTDPQEGITNSIIYSLNKLGISEENREKLMAFIGPPLVDSYMKYYNFSKEKAEKALQYYREFFSETGIFQNRLYKGIKGVLKHLKSQGKTLAVASSKPQIFVKKITDRFGITKYFDFVGGATLDESRSYKKDVLEYVIKELNVKDRTKVVLIGDREQDVYGAKQAGIDCVGVLYGYGDYKELSTANPTRLIKRIYELKGI